MQRCTKLALYACLLSMLSGCQYFSFWKSNTTTYNQNTSPEAVCTAMGATEGYASLDYCVRREELARGHNEFGF